MELKEWIRAARERKGMNQTQFGFELGVGKQAVSHWETGRNECSVLQFLRIARLANMSPAELDDWPADLTNSDQGETMTGWPLPPELLAALQNADPRTLKRAQMALMAALDIELAPVAPIQETDARPA
jgi:transcriptional regulator with XRE-family HTH domain